MVFYIKTVYYSFSPYIVGELTVNHLIGFHCSFFTVKITVIFYSVLTSSFHCYMMKMFCPQGKFYRCTDDAKTSPEDCKWANEVFYNEYTVCACVFYHLFVFLEGRILCTVLVRRHCHNCVRGSGTTVTLTLIMCWWLWWPSSPSQRLRAGQRKTIAHTHTHPHKHTHTHTHRVMYLTPEIPPATHTFLHLSRMIASKGCFVRFNSLLVTVLSPN